MTEAVKILYVNRSMQSPPHIGEQQRMFHIGRQLREIGSLTLLCVSHIFDPKSLALAHEEFERVELMRMEKIRSCHPTLFKMRHKYRMHWPGYYGERVSRDNVCRITEKIPCGIECFDSYLSLYVAGLFMWTSTVIVKRQALIEAGMFAAEMIMGEDNDMWYRLSYRWPRVGYIREPLSVYHICNPTSASHTHNQAFHLCRLVERNLKTSAQHGCYEEFLPVASMTLEIWMREILAEKRISEIRYLLVRYGYLLPLRFRGEMYVQTTFLDLGSDLVEIVHRLKNRFRSRSES